MSDFLIIGAGFYGCVLAERIANELKKKVTIFDVRDHIGGNCYSEIDKKTGIEYHKYGTHIFHTNNQKVWDYINQFCEFNNYRHQVLTKYKGKTYQMPINLKTINEFYKKDFNPLQAKNFLNKIIKRDKYSSPKNFEEKAISLIGKDLYSAFIKGYTFKQWLKDPKLLPASIINRLPVRFNFNNSYFNNSDWQGIPDKGYTDLFKNLLKNDLIKVKLGYDYKLHSVKPRIATIYTGPLDKLFDYKYGKLEWKSVSFKNKIIDTEDYQGNSVINFAEIKTKYTRIHEPRHLHSDRKYPKNKSLIIFEYPDSKNPKPYYPVNDTFNRKIHRKYKKMSENLDNFFVGGRLGDYAYYDMDMTISASLKMFENKIKNLV